MGDDRAVQSSNRRQPAMTNGGDDAIDGVAQGHGDPQEDGGEPPWQREPAGDAKRRRRAQGDLSVLDQDDAARAVARDTELGQQFGGLRRLRRAEPEVALRVARGDESHRSFAERAGTVEQNDARHASHSTAP
jgi:hypothetical protein